MNMPAFPTPTVSDARLRGATTHRLWCWRDGRVEFGQRRTPQGAIRLATFRTNFSAFVADKIVSALARHAHDGHTLLVPGVPEAANDDAALDALCDWRQRLAKRFRQEIAPGAFQLGWKDRA